jgi:UDP-N-acetylmuramyl pentapeptide synthase
VSRPPWYRLRGVGIALLRRLARRYVRRTQPRVVAITGSQGKTVLKRTLNDILSKGYRVRANPLSHNTAIGLPLAILGCELDTRRFLSALQGLLRAASVAFVGSKRDDVLILELGIRQAGDMAAHLEIVRPEIAIVTPLVPSFSTDHEALAVLRQEVVTLCRAIEGDGRGVVLLCRDDPALATLAQEFARARLYAKDEAVYEGDRWVLQTESGRFHSSCDLVGASSLYAFAAAIRAAQALGMEGAAIERALNPGG